MSSANPANPRLYLVTISAIAAIAGLLLGFDTGIISGALLFIENDFPVTTLLKELIVSSVILGAMFGSPISGRLTDQFGRRKLMLLTAFLFVIGTLISALASSVYMIIAGRLVLGFATGMGTYIAPLYIAEIAPTELRGGLVTFNQLAITIGIAFSYMINYFFTNIHGTWRWMFGIGFVPAILLAVGMFFLPESPRWLVKQNKIAKARAILAKLRSPHLIDSEINEIKNSFEMRQASFAEVFSPWIRPVLLLGATLGLIQQVTGINTIIYYAPSIFKVAGFQSASSSILATVGIGIVNVIATIFAILFLDRWGRRPLLLTGLTGMGISLFILSIAFMIGSNSASLRIAAVVCTFTYIICFAFSLGPILWLVISEIFPLEVRAQAMSIAILSCWFWNFVVSATFLTLLSSLGPSMTFLLYASMCGLSLLFCYFKVPETNGITLEQIENNIRNRMPLRQIGKPASIGEGILAEAGEY